MTTLVRWCDACGSMIPPASCFCAYCGAENTVHPACRRRARRERAGCVLLLLLAVVTCAALDVAAMWWGTW